MTNCRSRRCGAHVINLWTFRGDKRLDQRAKDGLVDGEREPRSRLKVGRVGERLLGERGDRLEGGIATEDLEQEPVKGGVGAEDPGTPTVPDLLADPLDGRAIQKVAEILPNPPFKHLINELQTACTLKSFEYGYLIPQKSSLEAESGHRAVQESRLVSMKWNLDCKK